MRPKNGRINKEGKQSFYYVCELKEKSHGEKCNMANLNGLTVDALVIEQIKQLRSNPSHLLTKLAKNKEKLKDLENQSETEKKYLQIKIKKNQKAIACSIKKLSLIEDDDITLAIVNNIKELKRENQLLESKLLEFDPPIHLTTSSLSTLKYRSLRLASFGDELASLELTKQRSYISTLVEKIEWDGQNVEVYLLGPKSQKRMSQMFPDSVDRE